MSFVALDKSASKIAPTASFKPLAIQPAVTPPSSTILNNGSAAPNFSQINNKGPVFTTTPQNTGFSLGNGTSNVQGIGDIIKAAAEGGANQSLQGVYQAGEGLNTGNPIKMGEGTLNALAGAINAVSSPIAPAFASLGMATDYLGKQLGSHYSDNPIIPNDTATRIVQAILNAATIAGTFAGGAKEPIAPEVPTKVPVRSETPAVSTPIKVNTPMAKLGEYSKAQGYEPITPTDQLPVIQMGAKEKSTLPTIQIGTKSSSNIPEGARLVREGVKSPIQVSPKVGETQLEAPKATGRATQTLKPIEGTGAIKTRSLSEGVEANAIEKKLTDNFGDLPEYRQVSMKDQAQQAADFMTKDPVSARAVALGEKAPPKGLLPESVFVAAEQKAVTEGDVQTLRDLANSKLASSATTMGQRIRTLGERDPESPLAAIQDVQKARAEAQAARGETPEKVTNQVTNSIRKGNTKETWSDFIKNGIPDC